MDFVSDNLFTGGKLKILTIVDAHTRESPLTGVGFKYTGYDVTTSLDEAISRHGKPTDNAFIESFNSR